MALKGSKSTFILRSLPGAPTQGQTESSNCLSYEKYLEKGSDRKVE